MTDTKLPDIVNAIIKHCAAYGQPSRKFLFNVLTQAITEARKEEKEKCKKVFIDNVDWGEWSMSDIDAAEEFEEGYVELTQQEKKV